MDVLIIEESSSTTLCTENCVDQDVSLTPPPSSDELKTATQKIRDKIDAAVVKFRANPEFYKRTATQKVGDEIDAALAKFRADPEFYKRTIDDLCAEFSIEDGDNAIVKRLEDPKAKVKCATESYLVKTSLEDVSSTPLNKEEISNGELSITSNNLSTNDTSSSTVINED